MTTVNIHSIHMMVTCYTYMYIYAGSKLPKHVKENVYQSSTQIVAKICYLQVRIPMYVLLQKVLRAISDYAFVTTDYPLILSIENHVDK